MKDITRIILVNIGNAIGWIGSRIERGTYRANLFFVRLAPARPAQPPLTLQQKRDNAVRRFLRASGRVQDAIDAFDEAKEEMELAQAKLDAAQEGE